MEPDLLTRLEARRLHLPDSLCAEAAARIRTLEAALQEAQEPLLDASAPTTSAVDASESPDRAQQEE